MNSETTWCAPGRVNLIGEHTDYNDGFALPLAIGLTCRAHVRRVAGELTEVVSTSAPEPVRADPTDLARWRRSARGEESWAAYPFGVLADLRRRTGEASLGRGLRIELDSAVPSGAGLSSSAALTCSVARALDDLYDLGMGAGDLSDLLAVTRAAENDFVGAPTGGMDQLASLHGEDGYVLLCDMRALSVTPVPLPLEEHGLALIAVDSGVAHGHADGEYSARRRSCEDAARALEMDWLRDATLADVESLHDPVLRRRARHVVAENARVLEVVDLLRSGDARGIGPLLTASHASMRDDFAITEPTVDRTVEVLLASGALGARMTGGGFGGTVIGLVESHRVPDCEAAVLAAYDDLGVAAPAITVHRPSRGAHRC